MPLNTLDIDLNATKQQDKKYVEMIIAKIKSKSCCKNLTVKDSSFKGYHIKIICTKQDCLDCRMVFDDQNRFVKDLGRASYSRNVLFTEKKIPKNVTPSDRKQINVIKDKLRKIILEKVFSEIGID